MIEVIDPVTKNVVATHTFDGYITALLAGNRVASYVENADGIPIMTIHRLTLRNASKE